MKILLTLLAWLLLRPFIKSWSGLEKIPRNGRVILAGNHESYIDGILMVALIRLNTKRVPRFVAMKSLFRYWWSDLLLRRYLKLIPLNGSTEKAAEVLENEELLVIFPEGHRTQDGNMLPPRTGVAVLALQTNAPVYPFGLHTFSFWPAQRIFPRISRSITVNVGRPVNLNTYKGKGLSKANRERVTAVIMDAIKRLRKHD